MTPALQQKIQQKAEEAYPLPTDVNPKSELGRQIDACQAYYQLGATMALEELAMRWVDVSESRPKSGWYNARYEGTPCVLDTNEGNYIITFPNGKLLLNAPVDKIVYLHEPTLTDKKEDR